jgi:hypothetical protein
VSRYTVFYEDDVLIAFNSFKEMNSWRHMQVNVWPDLYQKGYIYNNSIPKWVRMDLTPVLPIEVPKKYQLLLLLLN